MIAGIMGVAETVSVDPGASVPCRESRTCTAILLGLQSKKDSLCVWV